MGKGGNTCNMAGEILDDYWTGGSSSRTAMAGGSYVNTVINNIREASGQRDHEGPPGYPALTTLKEHLDVLKQLKTFHSETARERLSETLTEKHLEELQAENVTGIEAADQHSLRELYNELLAAPKWPDIISRESLNRAHDLIPNALLHVGALERLKLIATLDVPHLTSRTPPADVHASFQDVHRKMSALAETPKRKRGAYWRSSVHHVCRGVFLDNGLPPRRAAFLHIIGGYDPHTVRGDDGLYHRYASSADGPVESDCPEAKKIWEDGYRAHTDRWYRAGIDTEDLIQNHCPSCLPSSQGNWTEDVLVISANHSRFIEEENSQCENETIDSIENLYDLHDNVEIQHLADAVMGSSSYGDAKPADYERMISTVFLGCGAVRKHGYENQGMGANDTVPITDSEILLGPYHREMLGDTGVNMPSRRYSFLVHIASEVSAEFVESHEGISLPSMSGRGREQAAQAVADLFKREGMKPGT